MSGTLGAATSGGLPAWRDVIKPHPDVAQGHYKNAEFSAELAQVARGVGSSGYVDPEEFFAHTFITEGMAGLLEQSLRRVCGKDGDPVIQLKTAFGGGKTHSMIALYHCLGGRVSVGKLAGVEPILLRAGVSTLPKANIAALVGTVLNPAESRRPDGLPGVVVNTLWGEMAAQLAESAGRPELYDYVREADKMSTSPGSEALRKLFDACSPCLVLMDELVNYARKLRSATGSIPAGTFGNFITFIQEVTEAARASKNSLVVASIPESEREFVDGTGKETLDAIEQTFGRMESVWTPVAAGESFEIVRRRLFLDCKDPGGRDAVCAAFSRMYAENQSDFPFESKELEYKRRMVSCYPIHPEIFDRLYDDWATLERFQRTRGVLRLMAAVIHELWMANDEGLLIMPGSLPLDKPSVRNELTSYLTEGWNTVVDSEVDGSRSIPYQKDQSNPRFGGVMAARRVARAVMFGSAPTVREQTVRGIEASRIRLGVVQPPGDNIAYFNDALSALHSSLTYLYTNPSGDRYWYDTRPTLRKTAEDKASQMAEYEVNGEIEDRLRRLHREPPFASVHACPASSLDVPDEQTVRLVLLRPNEEYSTANQSNKAMDAVANILNNRGGSPRNFRNVLVFVAPDKELMVSLKRETRRYLAWKSIRGEIDSEELNCDAAQSREAAQRLKSSNETVEAQIRGAYCWLIAPRIDKEDINAIIWDKERTINSSGGNDSIATKAAKKMRQDEAIIERWSPKLLLMELDGLLWKDSDSIPIKKLWDYLCTYCYLPRLANEGVLHGAISDGLENSDEYFAYAAGYDDGRYIGLKFNQCVGAGDIERSGYLVKPAAARRQLDEERAKLPRPTPYNAPPPYPPTLPTPDVVDVAVTAKKTHFYMEAQLDTVRIGRDVDKFVQEVINHIANADGAQVTVKLDVVADAPDGFPHDVVRTVSENCKTLKVEASGFD